MFAGQMGCEALNFVLKRIIKEERPKRMCFVHRFDSQPADKTSMA